MCIRSTAFKKSRLTDDISRSAAQEFGTNSEQQGVKDNQCEALEKVRWIFAVYHVYIVLPVVLKPLVKGYKDKNKTKQHWQNLFYLFILFVLSLLFKKVASFLLVSLLL